MGIFSGSGCCKYFHCWTEEKIHSDCRRGHAFGSEGVRSALTQGVLSSILHRRTGIPLTWAAANSASAVATASTKIATLEGEMTSVLSKAKSK